MLQEVVYQDMIFGVFPKIAVSMDRSICSWPKNSVEDILDMICQALEVRHLSMGLQPILTVLLRQSLSFMRGVLLTEYVIHHRMF
jgi:hypothetical protein